MIPKSIFAQLWTKPGDSGDLITLEAAHALALVRSISDGRVGWHSDFRGLQLVKKKVKGSPDQAEIQKLAAEFEKIKYFSLDDEYVARLGNVRPSGDRPAPQSESIQLKGKMKVSRITRAVFGIQRS